MLEIVSVVVIDPVLERFSVPKVKFNSFKRIYFVIHVRDPLIVNKAFWFVGCLLVFRGFVLTANTVNRFLCLLTVNLQLKRGQTNITLVVDLRVQLVLVRDQRVNLIIRQVRIFRSHLDSYSRQVIHFGWIEGLIPEPVFWWSTRFLNKSSDCFNPFVNPCLLCLKDVVKRFKLRTQPFAQVHYNCILNLILREAR